MVEKHRQTSCRWEDVTKMKTDEGVVTGLELENDVIATDRIPVEKVYIHAETRRYKDDSERVSVVAL